MAKAVESVAIELTVVLGSATMPIHQLLKMGRGAVIELEAGVDDHAYVYANNRLVARAEVVLVGDQVAVSITEALNLQD